jgi:hypothetical protein
MVDVPIVSEQLQQQFRNSFPAQVSSGRDLHVSDVIVPIVDFTQASEGSALQQNFNEARNENTSNTIISSVVTGTDIITASGFYNIRHSLHSRNDADYTSLLFLLNTTTSATSNVSYLAGLYTSGDNGWDEFTLFVASACKLQITTTSGSGSPTFNSSIMVNKIADVYGNIQGPANYFPQ